jgi:sugar O-acyltransferase (sialic acid O-acetyltransferase NeuD family)
MAKIVIFGAGYIARLAEFYFSTDSEHEVVAFTVDAEYLTGETFLDRPLIPFDRVASMYPPSSFKMFVALSYARMNQVREAKCREARAAGYDLVSYVSSRCSFLTQYPIGDNCFILEDNTVQPFVRIGSNVTLWSGNHIGHDSTIGDHSFVSSHVVVSGHVQIGSNCFIGVNATLGNGITVGAFTLVGAGALIMKDTTPLAVFAPSRTKPFQKTSDQIDL